MNSNTMKSGWLIMATLCWGVAIPLSKMVLPALTPAWLIFLQIAASVIVLLFFAVLTRTDMCGLAARNIVIVGLIGMLEPCAAYYLGFIGIQSTSALHASIIYALEPLGIIVFNIVLFRFRVDFRLLIAGIFALAGVVLIALGDIHHKEQSSIWGDLLIFAGVMVAALYVSLSTQYVKVESVATMLLIQQVGSLILAFIFLYAETKTIFVLDNLPGWSSLWPALAIGVLQFALAFLFYFRGTHDNNSYWSVIVLNLTPIIGIIASVSILGESTTPIYFLGGATTIGAAIYTHLHERHMERQLVSARSSESQ